VRPRVIAQRERADVRRITTGDPLGRFDRDGRVTWPYREAWRNGERHIDQSRHEYAHYPIHCACMRVLLWHGWLLEGSGSNVYTGRVADVLRRAGHDVLLVCQERQVDRYEFLDAWGTVGPDGVSALTDLPRSHRLGRGILLRPDIGTLLPVFVIDEYEGFEVKRFPDLTERELSDYLDRNVAALRAAVAWFNPDVAIAGHAVPGAVIAARALRPGSYTAKIHGSDLEYAIRLQPRYRELAREGLAGAAAVAGATGDVLARTLELIPSAAGKTSVVPPGVEVDLFEPAARRDALQEAAARLHVDLETARGRPSQVDELVREAVERRDATLLHDLAHRYDQSVPDPDAAERLLSLSAYEGPLVGYLGKLIPQKGVELFLSALPLMRRQTQSLVVGFGLFREWLQAFLHCLDRSDQDGLRWVAEAAGLEADVLPDLVERAKGLAQRVTFTGRLDHRYAPKALAALDVLVVPSILDEAFGMVAAEAASAGTLPLVARHSGLAEVGAALETAVDRPGLFTFDPGPGSVARIAAGLDRLLGLPPEERDELRMGVSRFVAREWTWERTAERLLIAAGAAPVVRDRAT
jgi:glycosyltransferase involved in cell wall biosynthesis